MTCRQTASTPSALTLDEAVPGGIRECNNHCEFCFIRGLPSGLRPSLYVFDDDYRYSFLWGNFLTLTNLDEADWARIGYQRLSPLNVSVHATDPDVRRRLLNNRHAPDILPQLARLARPGHSGQRPGRAVRRHQRRRRSGPHHRRAGGALSGRAHAVGRAGRPDPLTRGSRTFAARPGRSASSRRAVRTTGRPRCAPGWASASSTPATSCTCWPAARTSRRQRTTTVSRS